MMILAPLTEEEAEYVLIGLEMLGMSYDAEEADKVSKLQARIQSQFDNEKVKWDAKAQEEGV